MCRHRSPSLVPIILLPPSMRPNMSFRSHPLTYSYHTLNPDSSRLVARGCTRALTRASVGSRLASPQPFPEGLRPPTPIRQKGNDLFSTQDATSFETTFRSAFVKHQVKPYRKPARPTNAWLPPE